MIASASFGALGTTRRSSRSASQCFRTRAGCLRRSSTGSTAHAAASAPTRSFRLSTRAGRANQRRSLLAGAIEVALTAAGATRTASSTRRSARPCARGLRPHLPLVRNATSGIEPIRSGARRLGATSSSTSSSAVLRPGRAASSTSAQPRKRSPPTALHRDRAQRGLRCSCHSAVTSPSPANRPRRLERPHRRRPHAPLESAGPVHLDRAGGVATSSTTVRRWRTDDGEAHHLIDPRTGLPAPRRGRRSASRRRAASTPTSRVPPQSYSARTHRFGSPTARCPRVSSRTTAASCTSLAGRTHEATACDQQRRPSGTSRARAASSLCSCSRLPSCSASSARSAGERSAGRGSRSWTLHRNLTLLSIVFVVVHVVTTVADGYAPIG